MAVPETLAHLVKPWADFYSDSTPAQTIVTFVHIVSLVVGGGLAIVIDRGTLRASDADSRSQHLIELGASHRTVLWSLVFMVVSGLLLLAADLESFLLSPIFWTKMVLIVLLLANGLVMQRAQGRAAWPALRRSAWISLSLWFAITFVGVALMNAA